jgi:rubrerythrin
MSKLADTKTEKDLKDAFAGESQANRKYLAFAKKADEEGYPQVAKLFRAAAESETVHAHSHLRILGAVADTPGNLQQAVEGESYEFMKMYPAMIEEAKVAGFNDAQRSFNLANQVEQIHAALFQKALDLLGSNPEVDYYVCGVCGYLAEGEAPEKCPVCGAGRQVFKQID